MLAEAFAQCVLGMTTYMTEPSKIDIQGSRQVEAKGRDVQDLLFHLLDEFLYVYGSEYFVCKKIEITYLDLTHNNHEEQMIVRATGYGEKFDHDRYIKFQRLKNDFQNIFSKLKI